MDSLVCVNNMRCLSLYVFFALVWSACSSSTEFCSPNELVKFVSDEDHKLVKRFSSDRYDVEVSFLPSDLLIWQELRSTDHGDSLVGVIWQKYAPFYYFVVKFSYNGREALHTSNGQLIERMAFHMKEFVTLEFSGGSQIPVDFLLDRTFGLASGTAILFAFEKAGIENKKWIDLRIREFGLGFGNRRFRFSVDRLKSIPRIYRTPSE